MTEHRVRFDPYALLEQALSPGGLRPVYQPIVRLASHDVFAHEGLMRVADLQAFPLALLERAKAAGTLERFELLAIQAAMDGFDFAQGGRLFLNISGNSVLAMHQHPRRLLDQLGARGQDLGRFVIEITERDTVDNVRGLADALAYLRAAGVRVALDDFGHAHSNFALWMGICPDYLKIDRCLVHNIAQSSGALSILRALIQIADDLGSELIAEGVERQEDLEILRDLGVTNAQGYLLGRPLSTPCREVPDSVLTAHQSKLPVLPRNNRATGFRNINAGHLLIPAPCIGADKNNLEAERLFQRHPNLAALPVVNAAQQPLGLINRRIFSEWIGRPFSRELNARRSCTLMMHASPVVCDVQQNIDEMSAILLGEDQRYLTDGFIITREGRYLGVATGEALVRRVTELRIEAARYANPLTLLPGNMPISEHIGRLLRSTRPFVAAYCDLNYFKPYNDQYGYFRGDRMIQLVAATLQHHVQPNWDFVGHVGGDDFVMLLQSDDWMRICQDCVRDFNEAAKALFDPDDLVRGMLEGEDRNGQINRFPLTTLTIGVAMVQPGQCHSPEEVASLAAAAKRQGKRQGQGVFELAQPTLSSLELAET